ncbi:MAG: ChaN family lipoprotein [Emcibacter sp.]|nr:ChaN family lipoprotein [Emcibacter sp.]
MKHYLFILFLSFSFSLPALAIAETRNDISFDRIWNVAHKKFITKRDLFKQLDKSQTILLGIGQDNPRHQNHAADIVRQLLKARPGIFVSNVERNKQNAFAIFTKRHQEKVVEFDATGLDMLLNWAVSGQAAWDIARPVFDVAMLNKLPLHALNLSRYEIGQIHRKALGGLPPDIKPDLAALLSKPVPEKLAAQITEGIAKDFCGILPPNYLEKLALIQRAQTGIFAQELIKFHERAADQKAILISSSKHIMKDLGVPYYLEKLKDQAPSISLLFLESETKIPSPGELDIKVDFIWVTPKEPRISPCENLKEKSP